MSPICLALRAVLIWLQQQDAAMLQKCGINKEQSLDVLAALYSYASYRGD